MPVYQINKGVNRPLEFKGIKGVYIKVMGAGLVLLFMLFVILFTAGCNTYASCAIILPAGALLFLLVIRLSKKYGENGLFKRWSRKLLPHCITTKSRSVFFLANSKVKSQK
jgi:hypothetical protein